MKFTKYILIACLFSLTANAGMLLEPYVGYHTGTESQSGSSNSTLAGTSYGARLGWEGMVLMLGADYQTGSWTDTPTSGSSVNTTPSDIGAFIGFNLPIIRGYAEYIVSSSETSTISNQSQTLTGSGYKVGLGFKILPLLSINLEYMGHTYTKDSAGTLSNNISDSMYGATISLPLNLFSK